MVDQFVLPTGQIVFSDAWYASDEGRYVFSVTDDGRYLFAWEATYKDRKIVRQFEDVAFTRAMTDEEYIPSDAPMLSVDALDKEQVVQFSLAPLAFTRKHCSWFQKPIIVQARPDKGEFFKAYWLTDQTPRTGYALRRHVVGIRHLSKDATEELHVLTVISPSGQITICASDDFSFEGE